MTTRHPAPVAAPTKATEYERELHRYYEAQFATMQKEIAKLRQEVAEWKRRREHTQEALEDCREALQRAGGSRILMRLRQERGKYRPKRAKGTAS